MELWKVRKEYRQIAMRLRRRRDPMGPDLEQIEDQLLVTLALCDRYETELSVLRLARRCSRARLRRLRRWVELSGIFKSIPAPLIRKEDEGAADDLVRAFDRKGRETNHLRQLLEELGSLEHRLTDAQARLDRVGTLAVTSLQQLRVHAGVPAARR